MTEGKQPIKALLGHERPVRVLLVEDNRADYLYTRALLSAIDKDRYELDWVSTYAAGERELARSVHDVYLLDYRLGDGTGLDLLRKAIADGCKKPLILLTAYGDDDIDMEAISAGAADYVMKGEFDARLLERSIRYALGRAQTLEALHKSQERYALAVQGANDAIWDWDLLGERIYLSPRWNSMYGAPRANETSDPQFWFARVHPDDEARLSEVFRAHLKGESPHFECEFRVRTAQGSYRWLTARGLAVRDPGTGIVTRMAGSITDTSERTLQDHQLRAILTSMVEGVIAVDGQVRVMHLNDVAAAMLGTSVEEAVGRPIAEISPLVEASQMLARAVSESRALHGEVHLSGPEPELADSGLLGPPSDMENRRNDNSGHASHDHPDQNGCEGDRDDIDGQSARRNDERTLELRASPLRARQDDVSGAVLVLHDITELRRLEGLQREFVTNVSHELKTPLAAILGLVDTLIDDETMEVGKQKSFLGRIGRQSERLSALVSDLLTLARTESLEERIERRSVDLCALGQDSADRLESTCAEHELRLSVEVAPAPVLVRGDEELLRQVIDNLLINAIKYTPAGGAVHARICSHGARGLVEVEDTGIGIAPEHHGRIFERFYRVDKARSRAAGGTGLGLAIVKNVMLAHDGTVSVESTIGRGSTFRVLLPLTTEPFGD